MTSRPELRILLATSFSDACFRSIRAVAQYAGSFDVDLTIAHVLTESGDPEPIARRDLESFFGEADHYPSCRRLLLQGDPLTELSRLARAGGYDLVMAPESDRIGLSRLFRPSFRARLLRQSGVPLWTIGAALDWARFGRRIRTIACLVDLTETSQNHLRLAAAMASATDASLRVMHVIEPVHEGTLARFCVSAPPLCADQARDEIYALCRSYTGNLDIDILTDDGGSELKRVLTLHEADLLFAGRGQVLADTLLPGRMRSYLRNLPCPVVCTDGSASHFRNWSFEVTPRPSRDTTYALS